VGICDPLGGVADLLNVVVEFSDGSGNLLDGGEDLSLQGEGTSFFKW